MEECNAARFLCALLIVELLSLCNGAAARKL